MEMKRLIRNIFRPTKMLDTGHIDRFNALPNCQPNNQSDFDGSLNQYVANRFTRGSIRGQIFALLSQKAINERMQKSSKIKWL